MPGVSHDRHRVEDGTVRVFRGADRLRHAPGAGGRVSRVDEAGVDLAPRDILERLADVLREDEPVPEALPQAERLEALLGILANRYGPRIADHDLLNARAEQVGRRGDPELRIGRRDDGQDIAGEEPACARPDQTLPRSEEHTSELQSLAYLVCRLLLEKKKQ